MCQRLLELGAGFHPELTGRENVFLNGAILGLSKRRSPPGSTTSSSFAGLPDFIDTPVKNYSSGMFVRLGFAVAAHVEPDVLLIDEVLSVGDESFQRRCAEKIDEFRRDGRTIVFVSHGLSQVEQLCEDAAWIDKGELKMLGKSAEVISAYQGQSHQAERVEGEQGSRWGSGEAQIVHVELRRLRWRRPGGPHDARAGHDPRRDDGAHAAPGHGGRRPDRQSRRRCRVGDEHPAQWPHHRADRRTGSVDVAIGSLPLLEGVYDLTVALTDHTEVHPYDHWERRVRFEVRQFKSYDTGLVSIPAEWTITGARGALQSGS